MTMSSPFAPDVASAGMRAMSAEWFNFQGIGRSDGAEILHSLNDYGRAPADEAWVYRCVALKASFAQSVPLLVEVRDDAGWLPADETSDSAALDLQGLLDDVNPVNMNGSDLKAWSVAATSVWGETYWRKVRGRFGGAPQELFWLRSPDITPKAGRVAIESYDYHPSGGTTENYVARDIVPFRRLNLQDPNRGLSPLSAARYDIAVNRYAAEWNANTLANRGVPEMYWQIPKDADFTPQDTSLVKRALRALRGPRNQGKAPILPQGLEAKILSLTPKDAEWLAARKVSRMTICAVEGVPLVLAGDDDKNTVYANLRDAERIFARYMIGELDWFADGMNGWLLPDFDPSRPGRRRIRIRFDYSEIEALQAPLESRQRVALSEVQVGVRGRREYRRTFKIGRPADMPEAIPEFVENTALVPIDEPVSGSSTVEPGAAGPGDDPAAGTIAADAVRVLGRELYRQPAVRAWVADPAGALDTGALIGLRLSDPIRHQIEAGLRRRASAAQIADALSEGASR